MSRIVEARCKGCNAEILFIKNDNGKAEPFDKKVGRIAFVYNEELPDGTVVPTASEVLFRTAHYSHFVTCPKAAQFRRPRT